MIQILFLLVISFNVAFASSCSPYYNPKKFIGGVTSDFKPLTPEWKEYVLTYIPGVSKYSRADVSKVSPAIHIKGVSYVDDASFIKIKEQ